MKLPIKVLLSYLGLGVGCLGTYAAVSVFDNKQIEAVVDDYEKEEEVVVATDSPKVSNEPSTTEVVVETPTTKPEPSVAPVAALQIKPAKATAKRTRSKRSSKPRGARIQTLQRVKNGGVKWWEKFADLASKFVRR